MYVLEKLFCKGKNLKQCQVKKEPINPISVVENQYTVSVNVWNLLMDVKYYQAAERKDVIN